MNKLNKILWQARMQKKTNWLKAKKMLEDATFEFPKEDKLHLALAELFTEKALHKKAIKHYHKAITIAGQNDMVLFRMGNCFLTLNEFKMALDYYGKVEDEFPEMIYNKAYAYSKIGRLDLSIQLLEEMKKYNLHSEIPLIFLAELYFSQKEYENALENLNKAEKQFGPMAALFYLRALTYSHLDNWLKAYLDFRKAANMKFKTVNFYKNFGTVCQKIGKWQEAVTYYQQSIQDDPANAAGYIELLRLYVDHEMIDQAYDLVKLARKSVPFSLTLTLLYSQIIEKKRNKEWDEHHYLNEEEDEKSKGKTEDLFTNVYREDD